MIPGFLNVQVGTTIRAGGAVAAFIVVFFFSPAGLVATPSPLKEHVGFLSSLEDHFQRHVPSTEFSLNVVRREDNDVGRFWIEETTDEDWIGLFKKICERYSVCMTCDATSTKVVVRFPGPLAEGLTAEGVKKFSCRT